MDLYIVIYRPDDGPERWVADIATFTDRDKARDAAARAIESEHIRATEARVMLMETEFDTSDTFKLSNERKAVEV